MKSLILFLGFLSFSAFAAEDRELILDKHLRSGLVPPGYSFQKDCSIYRNGDVEVVLITGDVASGFTAKISSSKVWEIRRLIKIARRSEIVTGPILCDGGDYILTGHRSGKDVLIKEQKDCESYRWRRGAAARRLRSLARTICQF